MTYSYEDNLAELKRQLLDSIPPNIEAPTSIDFEGPFVVIYTKQPELIMEDSGLIKLLAKKLRKRIVLRSDISVRLDHEEAEARIQEIIPKEAEITSMNFDDILGEVIIEAKKPGIVIGQNGNNLRNITKEVFWRPIVVRTLPMSSSIISSIRGIYAKESLKRRKILIDIGKRIHRPLVYDSPQDFMVRFTPLGGSGEVGRSCLLIETNESKVLIDTGVAVGQSSSFGMFPELSRVPLEELDAVIITHAHLDHSGFVPFLYKYGYRGPVYCNDATLSLMTLLQRDYLNVAKLEGKILPYSSQDIIKTVLHTVPRRYGEVTDLSPDIRLTLSPAGHILGSSIVHLHIGNGQFNLAVAQDFKFGRSNLLTPANTKFPRLEALIMESTYGGAKDIMPSRKDSERQLVRIINQTVRNGGKVLIPTLAVGRAQELMIALDRHLRAQMMEGCPIYLDGLIHEATAIHCAFPEYLAKELQQLIFNSGENPFLSEWIVPVEHSSQRDEIIESGPCVIIATNGMLTGGSSVEYFHNLAGNPNNSIIFVSYQAERTLGRRVAMGAKDIRHYSRGKMKLTRVEMDVHQLEGFSGHSDRRELMNYVRKVMPKPKRVILVHGNFQKSQQLAESIDKRYHLDTSVILNQETIRLM
ncbi:MAG: beta-CASP ribonuclease aCPSF1 [Candidatus Odinarchaeota archaeon]